MGSIKVGSTAIKKVYVGSTEIKKVYVGSTLIYSSNPSPIANNLTTYNAINNAMTANGAGTSVIANSVTHTLTENPYSGDTMTSSTSPVKTFTFVFKMSEGSAHTVDKEYAKSIIYDTSNNLYVKVEKIGYDDNTPAGWDNWYIYKFSFTSSGGYTKTATYNGPTGTQF